MTDVSVQLERVVVTLPEALLIDQQQTFFPLMHDCDKLIAKAEQVLEELNASIASDVQYHLQAIELLRESISDDVDVQRAIISVQGEEKHEIRSNCPHATVRLAEEQDMTTTRHVGVYIGSLGKGICQHCGKGKVPCCPKCASRKFSSVDLGGWSSYGDNDSDALRLYRDLGYGFDEQGFHKSGDLTRYSCPDCQIVWFEVDFGEDRFGEH